jgi:hypothetical protein
MDPSRKGISSGTKTAAVIAVIFVVLASVYFIPSLSTGAASTSGSSQTRGTGAGSQGLGLLQLFGYFSQMDMQVTVINSPQANGAMSRQSVSYLVLGKGTWNATQYTRVEFSTPGIGNEIVAWFNAKEGIDRVDVLGQRNYTGSGAYFVASNYVTAVTLIPAITNNATLLSMLSKTSQNSTSIGPTQVDLATYSLAVPSDPYKLLTVRYATVTGTSERIAVYLHEKTSDGTDTTIQVLSITK